MSNPPPSYQQMANELQQTMAHLKTFVSAVLKLRQIEWRYSKATGDKSGIWVEIKTQRGIVDQMISKYGEQQKAATDNKQQEIF